MGKRGNMTQETELPEGYRPLQREAHPGHGFIDPNNTQHGYWTTPDEAARAARAHVRRASAAPAVAAELLVSQPKVIDQAVVDDLRAEVRRLREELDAERAGAAEGFQAAHEREEQLSELNERQRQRIEGLDDELVTLRGQLAREREHAHQLHAENDTLGEQHKREVALLHAEIEGLMDNREFVDAMAHSLRNVLRRIDREALDLEEFALLQRALAEEQNLAFLAATSAFLTSVSRREGPQDAAELLVDLLVYKRAGDTSDALNQED